jgi:hypothetical protein
LRNSQDDIAAGAPVQFSPVRLLQLQLQRRHSPPHGFWRQNRSERHPDWASLFEPEEEASVISEAFKVWVTILSCKDGLSQGAALASRRLTPEPIS